MVLVEFRDIPAAYVSLRCLSRGA